MSRDELIAQGLERPDDVELQLVVADAMEEHGELELAAYLRQALALAGLAADHPARPEAEAELSWLRRHLPADWRGAFAPPRLSGFACACYENGELAHGTRLHGENQDTECDAWKRLCDAIDDAAAHQRASFAPGRHVPDQAWRQIVTLPPSIGQLVHCRELDLYGSYLVRLPPEIGQMRSLEHLDTYTSYRLHWYPFELRRCRGLRRGRISRRAVYGNNRHPAPLPTLAPDPPPPPGVRSYAGRSRACSACGAMYEDHQRHRGWTRWRLGIDDLPLLINACSAACLEEARERQ